MGNLFPTSKATYNLFSSVFKKTPKNQKMKLQKSDSAATLKKEHQILAPNSGAWAVETGGKTNIVLNFSPCLT